MELSQCTWGLVVEDVRLPFSYQFILNEIG